MDKPTRLIHWTPARNLASIMREGIDPSYSRGSMKVVWACVRKLDWWAAAHIATCHGVHPDDLVGLVIDTRTVPLRRMPNDGVWTTTEVVGPHLIREIVGTSVRATEPVRGRKRSSDRVHATFAGRQTPRQRASKTNTH
jgi:RNA:NAD 2'-phosphotransferase (TPT1/KptA family)